MLFYILHLLQHWLVSFLIKKNVDSHICTARKDLQLIYGVMGDIHSNYDALMAVVDELRLEHLYKILFVLDIYFHADARDAVVWTARQLSNEYLDFLKKMPLVEELDGITLVHGSLNHPEFFDYIRTVVDAQLSFDLLKTPICFYGHTHIPLVFYLKEGNIHVDRGHVFDVKKADKVLINVGSVGQSRDWDLRASCAIYDTDKMTVEIRRVKYNINRAVQKIYSACLPSLNALRLM